MTDSNNLDPKIQRKIVLDFLASHKVGVFSTLNPEGLPEAAAMAYSQNDKLELIFQTPNTTRKYHNLQHNPHMAVVVGWSLDDFITLQYEGVAREVVDDQERRLLASPHAAKNEISGRYVDIPENKFFVVSPTSIRYSDIIKGIQFTIDSVLE